MKQIVHRSLLWDVLYLAILTGVSLFLISFYFNAEYLEPGFIDWIVHAFRLKSLEAYGLSSWSHTWSNGINLWESYQFLPHFFSLIFIKLFNLEIHRGMVLITICLFVLLRWEMYIVLRLLKFSPTTSLICACLSFAIAHYWDGVAGYSIMFGFTFFPIALYFWVQHFKGKFEYLFPYLIGLMFYIHVILGFYVCILWLFSILFSDKKIISFSTFVQLIIIIATSSIFWFPLVVKDSYSYSNSIFSSTYFLKLVISRFEYYGFGLFIIICFFGALLKTVMPIKAEYKWTKILTLFSLCCLLLVVIGTHLPLPSILTRVQFTRGVTLVAISILFAFAPVAESIVKLKSAALRGAFIFFFSLSLIESLWVTSVHAPQPRSVYSDPVAGYIKRNPNSLTDGRIWTTNIGSASYFAPLTTRFPYSYMEHLESNQIPARLSPLINYHPYIDEVPLSSLNRINDYFKITGTKYAFFNETSPYTTSFLNPEKSDFKSLGTIELPNLIDHVFQVPWEIRNSVLVDNKYKDNFNHFPFDLEFGVANDQTALDDYVHKFVEVLYKPENKPLSVTYPNPETTQIVVPPKRSSHLVYLNESYDTNWKAYFNNRLQTITPSGPNYMLITLENLEEGGTLILKHSWPTSFYVSLFLITLIPCELALSKLVAYLAGKKDATPN